MRDAGPEPRSISGAWPAYAAPVTRAPSTLALRVGGLGICALSFSLAGLDLAGVASKPTWHDVVFPPTNGASMLPKIAILSNAAPGWVVVLLVVGFGLLWAGCGWVALRHKESAAFS